MLKSRKLKLVSSKLKKYNHETGEWYFEEDKSQDHRLGQVVKVSYLKTDVNRLHSFDGPAIGKDHYVFGNLVTKARFKEIQSSLKH